MKPLLLIFLSLLWLLPSKAQTPGSNANGVLTDATDGAIIIGATILFQNVKDSTRSRHAISGSNGKFVVKNLEKAFYRVTVQSLGYKPYSRIARISETDINLGNITLEPDPKMLETVEIKGEVIPVEEKGDTLIYNADAFKVNPDASTADLVSKMPGIVVSDDGVTANGESIEQVLLDGKRFFGQDPLLSLNTIPAEVVQKVEVFDQLSEQAQMTGFNDGNTTKTMNVVTREEKRNGNFGKAYAGYGTDNRYNSGLNLNAFNKDRRLTLIGMSNNVNQQNFSDEDVAGISGSGGRGGFRPPNQGNFMTANQKGTTQTNSVGLNFTDDWKKAAFEGSYFYNKTNTSNASETNRESFLATTTQLYNENQNSSADNLNHRLNTRITYNLNEADKLIIKPSLSFQNNESNSYTNAVISDEEKNVLSQTENAYQSNNKAYNFNNNLTYLHQFNKIGRILSLDLSTQLSNTDRESYFKDLTSDSLIQYFTKENQHQIGSEITYTEPVGNTAQLSASYEINYNNRAADKNTFTWAADSETPQFSPTLSNNFVSGYTTHLSTVHLANRAFGKFFDMGVSYQHAILNNDQEFPAETILSKRFNSILPMAMGRIELKNGGDLFIRYSTSTSAPSVGQLQNVINNSNPLFISIGNPDLDQSFSHSLGVRMHKSNLEKNTSFSNFTRVQTTLHYLTTATMVTPQDSIITEDVIAKKGSQISRPINTNGYWNIANHTTHSLSLSKLKSKLNSTAGLSYRRLPGETNGIVNISNTYGADLRLSLVSNISKEVDFNLYYQSGGNLVKNSIQTRNSSNYITQSFGGKVNLVLGKGFVFRTDLSHLKYNGINDASDFNYTLWNMSIARKFLKNNLGELELSVFDLLKQNQSISQQVSASYLEEVRTQVLQQYFLLKFTYQFRRFV